MQTLDAWMLIPLVDFVDVSYLFRRKKGLGGRKLPVIANDISEIDCDLTRWRTVASGLRALS